MGGKLFDLRDIARGLRFVWSRGGLWRAIWPELKAYYRRDFHPWQTDNRALIAGSQAQDGHTLTG